MWYFLRFNRGSGMRRKEEEGKRDCLTAVWGLGCPNRRGEEGGGSGREEGGRRRRGKGGRRRGPV
jgi:hypothetical protein